MVCYCNGIQRFDGNRWLWLSQQKNSGTSLPDNDVTALLEDKHERFWIQTESGICLLNRNTFEFTSIKIEWLPEDKMHNIRSLVELQDGHVWFVLASGGLYYYNEKEKQFVSDYTIIPKSNHSIFQITYFTSHHQYFLGTDKGIVIYDVIKKQFYHAGFNPNNYALLKIAPAAKGIASMYLNNIRQLWFGSMFIQLVVIKKKIALFFATVRLKSGAY